MPKLKSLHFEKENNAGSVYSMHSNLYVNSTGKFWAEIPFDLWEVSTSYTTKAEHTVRFYTNNKGQKIVESDKAEGVTTAISALIDYLLECREYTEKVIVYSTASKFNIYESESGNLYPSGSAHPDCSNGRGHWVGNLNSNNPGDYSVGLNVHILDKTTYSSLKGDEVKCKYTYSPWVGSHHGPYDNYHDILKAFVGRMPCIDLHGNLVIRRDNNPYKEIPYTDEAAKFFCDLLTSICTMALKMERFLEDSQNLQKVLEQKELLKLGNL